MPGEGKSTGQKRECARIRGPTLFGSELVAAILPHQEFAKLELNNSNGACQHGLGQTNVHEFECSKVASEYLNLRAQEAYVSVSSSSTSLPMPLAEAKQWPTDLCPAMPAPATLDELLLGLTCS